VSSPATAVAEASPAEHENSVHSDESHHAAFSSEGLAGGEPPSGPEQGPGFLQQAAAVLAAFLIGAAAGGSGLSPQPQRQTAPASSLQAVTANDRELQQAVTSENELRAQAPFLLPEEKEKMDDKLAGLYAKLMDGARQAGTKFSTVVGKFEPSAANDKVATSRVPPSVVKQLRGIEDILDQAQEDVYDEVWVSLETYPQVLQAYVPVLNYYADAAFPDSGDDSQKQINKAQREALRFETRSYLRGTMNLSKAIAQRKVRAVEEAFAKTSLAYDRYLKAGDLYSGYDPVTSTTVFFRNIYDSQLQYTPIALEQPKIRDEVLVLQGPDKGKVGRVMWLGREDAADSGSKVLSAVVKLEPNPVLGSTPSSRGVKEVKAYPYNWIVLTRSSSQSYFRDFILATMAAVVSCGVAYPLETIKCRAQLNQSPIPPEGPLVLFKGVGLNILREAPNAGMLMAGFNLLTRTALKLPFIDGNNPNLKFLLMIPSGVIAMVSGTFVKVPLIDISKQVQNGVAGNFVEAVENVYLKPSPQEVSEKLAVNLTLAVIRGVPFGAFQCLIYEVMKDKTPDFLESVGCPIFLEPFIWGGVAGFCTGFLTNPPDVIITRMSVQQGRSSDSNEEFSLPVVWGRIATAAEDIWREEGPLGFNKGGLENALYFAPEAMIWFGVYEVLKEVCGTLFE